jgi:hypothetical protein
MQERRGMIGSMWISTIFGVLLVIFLSIIIVKLSEVKCTPSFTH